MVSCVYTIPRTRGYGIHARYFRELHAQHKAGDVVALTTELTNSFLFTGDGSGYMKACAKHEHLPVGRTTTPVRVRCLVRRRGTSPTF